MEETIRICKKLIAEANELRKKGDGDSDFMASVKENLAVEFLKRINAPAHVFKEVFGAAKETFDEREKETLTVGKFEDGKWKTDDEHIKSEKSVGKWNPETGRWE